MFLKPLLASLALALVMIVASLSVLSPSPVKQVPLALDQVNRRPITAGASILASATPTPITPKIRKRWSPPPAPTPAPKRQVHAVAAATVAPKLPPVPVRTTQPAPTPKPTHTPFVPSNLTGAAKAVAFAFAQIGKPYIWGGTGPYGFDCSGLTSQAWAYAGVAIPRTSEAQWAGLPHVPTSALEPGDILVFYSGASHVGLYVGGGYMIDASHAGVPVEKVAIAGYYTDNMIGAVRP